MKELSTKQICVLLAIVVVFLGAIVWNYIAPSTRLDVSATQLVEITKKIRNFYNKKIDYWKLDTKFVVDNNILTNLSYDSGKLLNALGKEVKIGRGKDALTLMPGDRSFDIVYKGLSMSECVILSTYQYTEQEAFGLLQITIISEGESHSFDWGEGDYKLPITRQEARKFCKDNSDVLWTME